MSTYDEITDITARLKRWTLKEWGDDHNEFFRAGWDAFRAEASAYVAQLEEALRNNDATIPTSEIGHHILTGTQIGALDELHRRAEMITIVHFDETTGNLRIGYHDENRAETITVNFAGRTLL